MEEGKMMLFSAVIFYGSVFDKWDRQETEVTDDAVAYCKMVNNPSRGT